jgi:hypothetical protein
MVKRNGLKLTLTGRSEIEQVKAPTYIPEKQRKFYREAVIAYNCSKTLAGLFFLRTLIEQYMRLKIGAAADLRGDELGQKYNEILPDDFKSRFPSLPKSYSVLSEAIHQVREDDDLFERERHYICKHLEAKDVYDRNSVK